MEEHNSNEQQQQAMEEHDSNEQQQQHQQQTTNNGLSSNASEADENDEQFVAEIWSLVQMDRPSVMAQLIEQRIRSIKSQRRTERLKQEIERIAKATVNLQEQLDVFNRIVDNEKTTSSKAGEWSILHEAKYGNVVKLIGVIDQKEEKLLKDVDNAKTTLDTVTQRVREVESTERSRKQQKIDLACLDESNREVQQLQAQYEKIRSQHSASMAGRQTAIDTQTQTATILRQQCGDHGKALTAARDRLAELKRKSEALTVANGTLQTNNHRVVNELAQLQQTSTEQIATLNATITEREAIMNARCEQEQSTGQQALGKLEAKATELAEAYAKLEVTSQELTTTKQLLATEQNALSKQLAELKEKLHRQQCAAQEDELRHHELVSGLVAARMAAEEKLQKSIAQKNAWSAPSKQDKTKLAKPIFYRSKTIMKQPTITSESEGSSTSVNRPKVIDRRRDSTDIGNMNTTLNLDDYLVLDESSQSCTGSQMT